MSGCTRVASAADWTRAWSTPELGGDAVGDATGEVGAQIGVLESGLGDGRGVGRVEGGVLHPPRRQGQRCAEQSPRVRKIVPRARRTPQEYGRRSCRPYDRRRGPGTGPHDVLADARPGPPACAAPAAAARGGSRAGSRKVERCRTCGYRYERQPGFLLGALTINTIVTFGLLAAVLLVGSILSYPDIAVGPMLIAAGRRGGGGAHRLLPLLLHDLGRRRPDHAAARGRRAGRCRRPRRPDHPAAARSGQGA